MNTPQNNGAAALDIYACQTRLIWANEREVEPRHRVMHNVSRDQSACWLIRRGGVRLRQGRRTRSAGPGQWLFHGSGTGEQRFQAGTRLVSIRFELRQRDGGPLFAARRLHRLEAADHPELEAAASELIARVAPWAEAGTLSIGRGRIPLATNFLLESAYYRWLGAYTHALLSTGERLEAARRLDARVEQAVTRIRQHPMRERFSEKELAASAGLGVAQLSRLFKRDLGLPPFAAYDRHRLELARDALRDSAMSVKEIAFELGFNSPPHFSNWFRRKQGCSPRTFRARGEEGEAPLLHFR